MMMTRAKSLQLLREEIGDCQRCTLCKERKNIVFGRGDPNSPLMFVGEAPGQDEDEQGLPFVGQAGHILDDMIEAMGWKPDLVYIANIIKCRPPENRYPTPEEVAICMPFVKEQIARIQPAILVTMGNLATKSLFDETRGIMSIRGSWRDYQGIETMLTYHPAFALRQPSAKRPMWKDARAIVSRLHEMGHPSPFPVKESQAR